MTAQSSKQKHGLLWWVRLALIFLPVAVAGIWIAGSVAKINLMKRYPAPGQLVDVGSFKMHIYCIGAGSPTVILDAGLNDFYVSWAKVQPEVAKTTRVCSYDRAALGWSEASPSPRTSEVMADELHALLQNAEIEPPYVLVGHSFGGINMRVFARTYPDEVAGMVLVDSAHENQGARLPFLKDVADELVSQFRVLSFINKAGLVAFSPTTIPNHGLPDEAYRQYQAVLATTDYFDGAIAETAAFYSIPPSSKIAGLGDLPLIVLSHGLSDTSIDSEAYQDVFEQEWTKMQNELMGLSSNSKRIIADKSGHYIQLDQPELVIESILEIVQGG